MEEHTRDQEIRETSCSRLRRSAPHYSESAVAGRIGRLRWPAGAASRHIPENARQDPQSGGRHYPVRRSCGKPRESLSEKSREQVKVKRPGAELVRSCRNREIEC